MEHSFSEQVITESIENLQARLSQEYESRDALTQKYVTLQRKYEALESKYKEAQSRSQFLSNENSLLTTKLSEQINIRSKLQLSKEEMAEELEELTRSLFEEANELVSKEAKARHETEAALSKSLSELSRLQTLLKDESSQLFELKERMKDMISTSGNAMHAHYPRSFPTEAETVESSPLLTSPVHFFLSGAEQGSQYLTAAASIWHTISWKGLADVWPETFEEWKNVVYYKPNTELVYSELERKRRDKGTGPGSGAEKKCSTNRPVRAEERPSFEFVFEPDEAHDEQQLKAFDEPSVGEESGACHPVQPNMSPRRLNPQWILEQLDSDLYVEFLHWLGRSSVPEPQFHAPLASSGSHLSLPSLLIQPSEFSSRPSTPQRGGGGAGGGSGGGPAGIFVAARPSSSQLAGQEGVKPPAVSSSSSTSSSSTSSDPFMRRAWEEDILPTLSFPLKSKSFSKKLMKSIASNLVSIEAVLCLPRLASSISTNASSYTSTTMLSTLAQFTASPQSNPSYATPMSAQAGSTFVSPSGACASESFASPPPVQAALSSDGTHAYLGSPPAWIPIKETSRSPKSLAARLNVPGQGVSDSPRSEIHDIIERARTASPDPTLHATVCSLCGRPVRPLPPRLIEPTYADESDMHGPLLHRLRLSDDESSSPSLLIDTHCRAKIVSVCDFFSFVRYYRQGFYSGCTNEHLYTHWLQLKRAMMYARTGSTSYFVASDVSLLMRRWHQGWYEWYSTEAQKLVALKKQS